MHLLEYLVARPYLDVHGREDPRHRRRGQQHVAEQPGRLRIAARDLRDRAHVPDHVALGIEVRRPDHEQPAVAILLRDPPQHLAVNVLGNQLAQRLGVRDRRSAEQPGQQLRCHHRAGVEIVPQLGEQAVVARAEEGVGRDQRAGADPRDHLEPRAIAALGPPDQKAGAEGPVVGPARQSQILEDRHPLFERDVGRQPLHVGHVRAHEGDEVLGRLVAPEAGVVAAEHRGLGHERLGHRLALDRRAADGERRKHARDKDPASAPTTRHGTPAPIWRPQHSPAAGAHGAGIEAWAHKDEDCCLSDTWARSAWPEGTVFVPRLPARSARRICSARLDHGPIVGD